MTVNESLRVLSSESCSGFTRAEQAQNHCQVGNMGLTFRIMIEWMTGLGQIERLTDE
jgi:hypothetical protein